MSENEFINCDVHGKQQTTFVCQHLAESLKTNKVVGFFCSTESSENPRPDAWCINCEEMLQSHSGEWSEEIEKRAGITILCGKCYDMTKKINDIFKSYNNRFHPSGLQRSVFERCYFSTFLAFRWFSLCAARRVKRNVSFQGVFPWVTKFI